MDIDLSKMTMCNEDPSTKFPRVIENVPTEVAIAWQRLDLPSVLSTRGASVPRNVDSDTYSMYAWYVVFAPRAYDNRTACTLGPAGKCLGCGRARVFWKVVNA